MKKRFLKMIALLTCASIIGGCAPKSNTMKESVNDKEEPVQITVWHSADSTIADVLQKQVDALKPDIDVKFERKENMAEALKLVGNDPDNAPDMYFWAHDKVGVFAAMDMLAPITDVISEDTLKDMLPMTVDAGEYEGKKYQLPIYYEALMFMYNKDLMKEAPKTTDELLQAMKDRTTSDHYVFVEQHSTSYNAAAWIQGYDGYIINSKKEPGLNTKETMEALSYHKDFVPYMPADGEYNTVTTLFTEGKAECTIGGPWLVPSLKEANINLGIAPMPMLPNGQPLKPFSGVQGVHVLKHAAESKKDAVAAVLETLANPETGIALAKTANCAPANQRAYENADVKSNDMIIALKEMAQNVIPMPNIPEMDVMWGVTDGLLASINKNGGDVQTECEKFQKDALDQIEAMQ